MLDNYSSNSDRGLVDRLSGGLQKVQFFVLLIIFFFLTLLYFHDFPGVVCISIVCCVAAVHCQTEDGIVFKNK